MNKEELQKIILQKEKEIKELKKEYNNLYTKDIQKANIEKSQRRKQYIKENYDKHVQENVEKYLSNLSGDFPKVIRFEKMKKQDVTNLNGCIKKPTLLN